MMAYRPTKEDIEELDKQSAASFRPTAKDFEEADNYNAGISSFDPSQTVIGKTLSSAGLGVLQNAADIVGGGINLGITGVNALGLNIPKVPKAPFHKIAPYKGVATAADMLTGFYSPFGAANVVSKAYKGAKAVPALLASMGDAALTGAGYSALYGAADPDSSVTQNALIGGTLGAGLRGAIGAPAAAANALIQKYTNKASHGLIRTPEEAAAIYEKAKPLIGDAKIDFGSLVGDKSLSRHYNSTLSNTYGGKGAVELNQHKLIGAADNEANKIMDDLRGNVSREEVPMELFNRIAELQKTHAKTASKMFGNITDEADSRGFSMHDYPSARAFAKAELEKDKKVLGTGIKGELKEILEQLSAPQVISNKGGKKAEAEAYKYADAHFSHSNIGKLADEYAAKQEMRPASVARDLQHHIRKDIEDSLAASQNKDLFERWGSAKGYFAKNVIPFRHPSLANIITEKKTSDQLAAQLLTGNHKAIVGMLDQDTKHLLGHESFNSMLTESEKKDKVISTANLLKTYNGLDNKRKTGVFSPEIRKRMDSLSALNRMIGEARIAENPNVTGFRNNPIVQDIAKYAGLASVWGATNPAAAGALGVGKYFLDKHTEKLLTGNALRQAYGGKKIGNPEKDTKITNALLRTIIPGVN